MPKCSSEGHLKGKITVIDILDLEILLAGSGHFLSMLALLSAVFLNISLVVGDKK